ncbi:MAG: cell filamentation protein Fic [Oceanospirillales bacterium]|nr:MAG: cell filamentation protein Fic [Oceanospirillales bacterium]
MKYLIESPQVEYEPGSNEQVLRNKLGIKTQEDINEAETVLLFKLYERIFNQEEKAELTFRHICDWHRQWLGPLYEWAGMLRSVNMSKGGFPFAAASHLPQLVTQFEEDFLTSFSQITLLDERALVSFLARSHVEFILIHPFREGNGRISRLLLDVMCSEANIGPLDYSLFEQHKEFYFKSIQAGVNGDYVHLEKLIRDTLLES